MAYVFVFTLYSLVDAVIETVLISCMFVEIAAEFALIEAEFVLMF